MPATPDPLDMLDVIEESRQRAMAQREAAVDHLASVALQAIVGGADVRDVARRCGFDLDAAPAPQARYTVDLGFSALWSPAAPEETTPDQRFSDWLAKAVKKLVLEGLEVKA